MFELYLADRAAYGYISLLESPRYGDALELDRSTEPVSREFTVLRSPRGLILDSPRPASRGMSRSDIRLRP